MIHTSKQLKDKVRNLSKGDNDIAKALIRTFMMERFLERVSLSKYRENIILKGGMLVASIVGTNLRATMDIDTTVKALPLNISEMKKIVDEIAAVPVEDGVTFQIKSITTIMDDFEYPGVRIMFEDRTIYLLTYNVETLLAEKMQTILSRGIANTRMRDFYDIYEITKREKIDIHTLQAAFLATCKKRETLFSENEINNILTKISEDDIMAQMWERFRTKNYFVGELQWEEVYGKVIQNIQEIVGEKP